MNPVVNFSCISDVMPTCDATESFLKKILQLQMINASRFIKVLSSKSIKHFWVILKDQATFSI